MTIFQPSDLTRPSGSVKKAPLEVRVAWSRFDALIAMAGLMMMQRVSGGEASNSGRHISRNRLRMPREQRITGLQFDVKVKGLKLRGCDAEGASDSAAKARGVMFLFNDGSSASSGNATGDVGAVVEVYKSVSSESKRFHVSCARFCLPLLE